MIGSSTTTEGPTERPGRDTMRIALVSLFPEMFAAVGDYGVVGRAVRQGQVNLSVCNPRDYAVILAAAIACCKDYCRIEYAGDLSLAPGAGI